MVLAQVRRKEVISTANHYCTSVWGLTSAVPSLPKGDLEPTINGGVTTSYLSCFIFSPDQFRNSVPDSSDNNQPHQ